MTFDPLTLIILGLAVVILYVTFKDSGLSVPGFTWKTDDATDEKNDTVIHEEDESTPDPQPAPAPKPTLDELRQEFYDSKQANQLAKERFDLATTNYLAALKDEDHKVESELNLVESLIPKPE